MTTEKRIVFISYAWEDKLIAKQLQEAIQANNLEVWIDYNSMRAGDEISSSVSDALKRCYAFLLIWSKAASESKWVKKEWGAASSNHKRIIPCLVDDTELPALLQDKAYVDLRNLDTGIRSLWQVFEFPEQKFHTQDQSEREDHIKHHGVVTAKLKDPSQMGEIADKDQRWSTRIMSTQAFSFVDRNVALEQARSAIKSVLNGGSLEYNLYGFFGAAGIGKSALLQAIGKEIYALGIPGFHYADGFSKTDIVENIHFCRHYIDQSHNLPAISIIDNLDQIDDQIFNSFKETCEKFVKAFIPKRIIFCTSKPPDRISKLLRPEQRYIHELSNLSKQESFLMLNQITAFQTLNQQDKDFLIDCAVGYPKIIEIFGNLLMESGLNDKKTFIWQALLRLTDDLFSLIRGSIIIEQFLARLCLLALQEGYMPNIAIEISRLAAMTMEQQGLEFQSYLDFSAFNTICNTYAITRWETTDHKLFPPLQNLLRKYMLKFEGQSSTTIYDWLFKQYRKRYIEEVSKEKGRCLLKLCFYLYQLNPTNEEMVLRYFTNCIKEIIAQDNIDAIELSKQEVETSEIGKIFGSDRLRYLIDQALKIGT